MNLFKKIFNKKEKQEKEKQEKQQIKNEENINNKKENKNIENKIKEIQLQKEKGILEKENLVIKDILNKIEKFNKIYIEKSETNNIESDNVNKDINNQIKYEDFLDLIEYKEINVIKDILDNINNNYEIRKNLEENLEDIFSNYNDKTKDIFSKLEIYEIEIIDLTKEIEKFTSEIKEFTIYANKINAKGQIELKQEYPKLQRMRGNLVAKEKVYIEKEKILNSKILDIFNEIKDSISDFNELREYILIYIEEESEKIQKTLSTFTKDKVK